MKDGELLNLIHVALIDVADVDVWARVGSVGVARRRGVRRGERVRRVRPRRRRQRRRFWRHGCGVGLERALRRGGGIGNSDRGLCTCGTPLRRRLAARRRRGLDSRRRSGGLAIGHAGPRAWWGGSWRCARRSVTQIGDGQRLAVRSFQVSQGVYNGAAGLCQRADARVPAAWLRRRLDARGAVVQRGFGRWRAVGMCLIRNRTRRGVRGDERLAGSIPGAMMYRRRGRRAARAPEADERRAGETANGERRKQGQPLREHRA